MKVFKVDYVLNFEPNSLFVIAVHREAAIEIVLENNPGAHSLVLEERKRSA